MPIQFQEHNRRSIKIILSSINVLRKLLRAKIYWSGTQIGIAYSQKLAIFLVLAHSVRNGIDRSLRKKLRWQNLSSPTQPCLSALQTGLNMGLLYAEFLYKI